MIKVIFNDDTSKNYNVNCRQLFHKRWDDIDYKWAFEPIAKIINVDVNNIKGWRVI